MNQFEKMKLVRKFLDKIRMPGVCGFLVLPHDIDIQVVIQIDLEWMKRAQTRPDLISNGMRNWLKKELQDYLGFPIHIGSTGIEKCS